MKLVPIILLLVTSSAIAQTDADTFYSELNKLRGHHHQLIPDTTIAKSAEAWIKLIGTSLHHNFADQYAEVLAISYDPLNAWLNSPPHKKTILNKQYRYVGYAIVMIDGKPVACARFR